MHHFNRLVDALHAGELVRDEVFDGQLALHVHLHQARHLAAGLEAAERGALPLATGDQLERASGYLMSGRRDTYDRTEGP